MSSDANLATITRVYEAFGRGDVDAILAVVADDVDWAADASTDAAPWWGRRTTKADVAAFFAGIAGAIEVHEFTPFAMAANDDGVFAVIKFSYRGLESGQQASAILHHYFRFNDEGKIVYYRGSEDTALTERTLSGDRSRTQTAATV
jgi:ketosteroid isomerase-like protein